MQDEIVTYYELVYLSNLERVKRFLTLNLEEVKIKTSEVLAASTQARIEFNTITAPKSAFIAALKKATQCV